MTPTHTGHEAGRRTGGVAVMDVPAGAEAARTVLRLVGVALEEAGWTDADRATVALAVDEAVQNAVEHGSERHAPIDVRIEAHPDRAFVLVADRGRPGAATPQDPPRRPHVHDIRGRGRAIMQALADEVRWRPRPGSGTEVVLVFTPDGAAA